MRNRLTIFIAIALVPVFGAVGCGGEEEKAEQAEQQYASPEEALEQQQKEAGVDPAEQERLRERLEKQKQERQQKQYAAQEKN